MINADRLAETFMDLVRIDSVSREEGRLALFLQKKLEALGAQTVFDTSAEKTGSDTGNLIARIGGNGKRAPLLFSAHMDTVEPGRGIQPVLDDGRITSDGTTILGADDKSAIAILLEMLQVLKASGQWHPRAVETLQASGALQVVLPTGAVDADLLPPLESALAAADLQVLKARAAALAEARGPLTRPPHRLGASVASALVLARRVLDPLREWSNVDPVSIGVAEYQSDLDPERL